MNSVDYQVVSILNIKYLDIFLSIQIFNFYCNSSKNKEQALEMAQIGHLFQASVYLNKFSKTLRLSLMSW